VLQLNPSSFHNISALILVFRFYLVVLTSIHRMPLILRSGSAALHAIFLFYCAVLWATEPLGCSGSKAVFARAQATSLAASFSGKQ
jgi:hypothetical protein